MQTKLFHKYSKNSNLFRFILALIVTVLTGLQISRFVTWSPDRIASHGLFLDDAYFYSVIAKNFAQYKFLTLDGLSSTNGVQPLWMAIQIFLKLIFSNVNEVTLLSVSSWCCYLLFAFFLILYVTKFSSKLANIVATILVSSLIILNPFFQQLVLRGLEIPLLLMILILWLLYFEFIKGKSTSPQSLRAAEILLLGLISAMVFYSRTDLFWVSFVVGLWLIFSQKKNIKAIVLYLIATVLFVTPYLLYNLVSQNGLLPMSGRVKLYYLSAFLPTINAYLNSQEWLGFIYAIYQVFDLQLGLFPILVITVSVFTLGFYIVWRFWNKDLFLGSFNLFSIIVFAHLFYMHIFYRELRPYSSYYFIPEILWLVLLISIIFGHLIESTFFQTNHPSWNNGPLIMGVISGIFVLLSILFMYQSHKSYHPTINISAEQRLLLCEDIDRYVPEGEYVGAFWPGTFAQFSHRRIVPLDGIISSNEYFQEYVKEDRELDYLEENSIEYIAIYLQDFPGQSFSDIEPVIKDWSQLGTLRLWEHRNVIQLIAKRTWGITNTGWYLFKFVPEKSPNS